MICLARLRSDSFHCMPRRIKLTWIPNFFTLANLSLGFFSIVFALRSHDSSILQLSGGLIFLAVLCDGLDGAAARLLNARSELGAQLDSLADLTTFGIAPAALMYMIGLKELDSVYLLPPGIPFGLALAAIYPACAAYRLARFNVVHSEDSFAGLPSPIAGLLIALIPFVHSELLSIPEWLLAAGFLAAAFLMVSTIKYTKPQVTFLRRFSRSRMVLLMVFLIGTFVFVLARYSASHAAALLLSITLLYVLMGLAAFTIHVIQIYRM